LRAASTAEAFTRAHDESKAEIITVGPNQQIKPPISSSAAFEGRWFSGTVSPKKLPVADWLFFCKTPVRKTERVFLSAKSNQDRPLGTFRSGATRATIYQIHAYVEIKSNDVAKTAVENR